MKSKIDEAVNTALNKILDGDSDAVTLAVPEVTTHPDGTLKTFEVDLVTLQPSDADETLVSHEAGHRQIYEMGTAIIDDKFTRGLTESELDEQLNFMRKAGATYDIETEHGKEGGPDQEQIADDVFKRSSGF